MPRNRARRSPPVAAAAMETAGSEEGVERSRRCPNRASTRMERDKAAPPRRHSPRNSVSIVRSFGGVVQCRVLSSGGYGESRTGRSETDKTTQTKTKTAVQKRSHLPLTIILGVHGESRSSAVFRNDDS
ncbi:hypothetical protein L1887_57059 [Cichorium endivia]|nr:hypothetical protein L1887_57059 [Cichorium endivia]